TLGTAASQNTTAPSPAQAAQTEQATDGQSQASAEPAITVTLENPPDQKTASGVGVVSGWAVSSTPGATISSVQFQIDGQQPNKIPCCSARKDVAGEPPPPPPALPPGCGGLFA